MNEQARQPAPMPDDAALDGLIDGIGFDASRGRMADDLAAEVITAITALRVEVARLKAQVGAAYEVAADKCYVRGCSNNYFVSKVMDDAAAAIRALTPADAQAALDGIRKAQEVRVKALEWVERVDIKGLHNAQGAHGWWYNVWMGEDGQFSYEGDPVTGEINSVGIPFDTLEAAKAAAQADYEARIRAALEGGEG